jgi:hypothetical protein
MESSVSMTASQVLDQANAVVASLNLPPEIEAVVVGIGPDHEGDMALWFTLKVKQSTKDTTQAVRSIRDFAQKLQEKIFESGIGLFPYTSVEQAA